MVVHMVHEVTLAEVLAVARPIVEAVVFCTATTIGPDGRPRSRVVHPVWHWDDEPLVGLVTSRPTPLRRRHLGANPVMTCAYWSPAHHVATFDCDAAWVESGRLGEAWQRIAATPPPLGFDPATIWPDGPTSDDFAVVELRPYRVQAALAEEIAAKAPARQWRRGTDATAAG
jgi:hypothetical protein